MSAGNDFFRHTALEWRKGAVEAIRALNDRGYYVFVTSGGASDASRLNAAMQASLAREGAHVDRSMARPALGQAPSPSAGTPTPLAKAMDEWPIVREKILLQLAWRTGDVEAAAARASQPICTMAAI